MNRSVVGRLVAKDLYQYRWLVGIAMFAGVAAVPISRLGPGDGINTGVNIGVIMFMTAVIALGIFIVMLGVLKERQDRSSLFVLSLPVSPMQYAAAKVAAALIAFLAPWIVLTAGTIVLIVVSASAPNGSIPSFVATMTFFLGNFCVLLALVLATASERWAIAGILLTNTSVPVFIGAMASLPGIGEHRAAAVAVWSPTVLTFIGVSAGAAVLSVGLAFWIRSLKKDFV